MLEMSWEEACSRRLRQHALDQPVTAVEEVAGRLCGVHAQVMPAAEVALGMRVADVTRADVRAAIWDRRTLVKTFGPRGTVHLFPADELALWMSALDAAPKPSRSLPQELRLSDSQREEIFEAIEISLTGTELTVEELDKHIGERAGTWATELVMPAFQGMWPRWRVLMSEAAHRGALCFGPNRGRNVTYTRPEDYQPIDGASALAEVALRYLRAYGPATPAEFARWFGSTPKAVSDLFASMGDRLVQVEMNGVKSWLPTEEDEGQEADEGREADEGQDADDDADEGHEADEAHKADEVEQPKARENGSFGRVRLLPYFDPYTVGCYPRELLFPGRAFERALSRGQAGNVPVMLIDGVVAGIWHQRLTGAKVKVTVEPFGKLTAAYRSDLAEQVVRLSEILEAEPSIEIGTVTAGKHA
jgi:Winged helix DNA-binding domain